MEVRSSIPAARSWGRGEQVSLSKTGSLAVAVAAAVSTVSTPSDNLRSFLIAATQGDDGVDHLMIAVIIAHLADKMFGQFLRGIGRATGADS